MDGSNWMRQLSQRTLPEITAEDFRVSGWDAYRNDDFEKARELFAEGLKRFEKSALLWHGLGRALQKDTGEQKDRAALLCYERAHILDPSNLLIQMDRASHISRRGHFSLAEHFFAKIYEAQGETFSLLYRSGHNYMHAKQWGLAKACFWQAASMDGHGAKTRYYFKHVVRQSRTDYDPSYLAEFYQRMDHAARGPLALECP